MTLTDKIAMGLALVGTVGVMFLEGGDFGNQVVNVAILLMLVGILAWMVQRNR